MDASLSADGTHFYLTTNEGSPYEQHLYSMSVTGGARTRITQDREARGGFIAG